MTKRTKLTVAVVFVLLALGLLRVACYMSVFAGRSWCPEWFLP